MAIMGAWGIIYLYKRPGIFSMFLTAGFLLGNRSLLVNAFKPNISPSNYRLVMFFLLLTPLIYWVYKKIELERLIKGITVGIVLVGIIINVIFLYNSFELKCESVQCTILPTTSLATIHFPLIWRLLVLNPVSTP